MLKLLLKTFPKTVKTFLKKHKDKLLRTTKKIPKPVKTFLKTFKKIPKTFLRTVIKKTPKKAEWLQRLFKKPLK